MAVNVSLTRKLCNNPSNLTSLYSLRTKIRPLDPATVSPFEFPAPVSSQAFDPYSFYASLINKSTHKNHLNQIHAQLLVSGSQDDRLLITKLINAGVAFGEIRYARNIFDEFREPDLFLWNAIIRGYSRHNMFGDVIELYLRMQVASVSPDCFSFPSVLKACCGLPALRMGCRVHGQIFRHGFESDVFVQNVLVSLYAKCGQIGPARVVFDGLCNRTVVSWTSIISGYAQNGDPMEALRIFSKMRQSNLKPDWIALVSVLKAYTDVDDLIQGKSVHGCAIKMGLEDEPDLLSSLTAMHAKCGSLIDKLTHKNHLNQIHAQLLVSGSQDDRLLITKLINASVAFGEIRYARNIFDKFREPDVFLWNAVIRGYSRHNMFGDAIELYLRMQVASVSPDCFTFPSVLKACCGLPALRMGCLVHGQIFRHGFESDVFVQNALVALYAKCDQIGPARVVFDGLCDRTVVSWTSIISGYAQNGDPMEALRIFSQMRQSNLKPDWIALVSVLKAYTDVDDLIQGKSIHGCVIKMGLEDEPDLLISLTAMYAKCGQVTVARSFFDQMETPSLTLWNAMISGYAKNGYAEEAVGLFHEMISKKIRIDSITMTSAILACAQVGSLELARWMDDYTTSSEYRNDVFVNTALIDMYAKCGSVDLARTVFDRTVDKDVVVWSAMIVGYGLHGQGREAIDLYYTMKQHEVCPNDVTFVGLLTACNHSGLLEEGWELFHHMRDYGIEPRHQHYACVVDLLGRSGHLEQAYDFIMKMPIEPGVSVWGALLSACKIYRHVALGEYAAEQLFTLDPYNTGHYVQLSNLYASARLWDCVGKVRVLMKEKGLSKDLGYSLIEINGKLQAFLVGDKSHPRHKEISEELERLEKRLKEAGFVPHTESVLHDLNYEETEETLCNHSERIAIAFGLISTPPGTTLRLTKNLRACVNCHSATKFISKLVNREIVVRDVTRFHHFKDGFCSCGDYW